MSTTFGTQPLHLARRFELVIDLGGNHQLPGIGAQQIEDDILDLLGRDHVALANEHGVRNLVSGLAGGIKRPD